MILCRPPHANAPHCFAPRHPGNWNVSCTSMFQSFLLVLPNFTTPAPPPPLKTQEAARDGDQAAFSEFVRITNELNQSITLRGLLRFRDQNGSAIPLDQVRAPKKLHRHFQSHVIWGSTNARAALAV